MDSTGTVDPACDCDAKEVRDTENTFGRGLATVVIGKDMEYLLGGYIVGSMTFCSMYSRLRSFFVTEFTLKSANSKAGTRNPGLGVLIVLSCLFRHFLFLFSGCKTYSTLFLLKVLL